jgi:hypothetical protein
VFLVAGGVLYFGYWLFAYGVSQVRGCNAGFFALGWPGKNPVCDKDTGATTSNIGQTGSGGACAPGSRQCNDATTCKQHGFSAPCCLPTTVPCGGKYGPIA